MLLKAPRRTLGGILMRRIAFFGVLAMLLQLFLIFSEYYWNIDELSRLFVEQETARLASGIKVNGEIDYQLPETVQQRYRHPQTGYVARIQDAYGKAVFESCEDACETLFLPANVNLPDFWLRSLKPGRPLTLVGGRAFVVSDQRFVVEVATVGDPQDVVSDVLWNEIIEHMIVPMSILLVLVLGATLLSVRQALKPVRAAADAAGRIDPLDARSHLPFEKMPREIAHLAVAVNHAFARVGELMRSQKILTSGIAHEVRTPLAAIKLELGRIDHPRARKAEADLDDLVGFVSQLTALARLDSFDHGMFEEVELIELSAGVVEQLAPWVYENNHSLELRAQTDTTTVQGVPVLLKDAVRNLVENAVRHTPARTRIIISVGDQTIKVEDRYPPGGPPPTTAFHHADSLGIGLKIVERIAALHQGSLRCSGSKEGYVYQLDIGSQAARGSPR